MEWNEIGRVMVVFAHPDDAEFGSAGTAAKMAREGKEIVYVVVTDGSKGSSDPAATPEALSGVRKDEQCNAAEIVGVRHVDFLDFEDGILQPSLDLRRSITAAIRRHKPDVVISQNPVRDLNSRMPAQHPDHLAAAEATFASVYPSARDRMTFPELLEQGLEPHAVRELWVAGAEVPNLFVDISQTLDIKVRALQAHVSQVGSRDVDRFVPERAKLVAEGQDMEYAEAFKRIELP